MVCQNATNRLSSFPQSRIKAPLIVSLAFSYKRILIYLYFFNRVSLTTNIKAIVDLTHPLAVPNQTLVISLPGRRQAHSDLVDF